MKPIIAMVLAMGLSVSQPLLADGNPPRPVAVETVQRGPLVQAVEVRNIIVGAKACTKPRMPRQNNSSSAKGRDRFMPLDL